MKQVVKVFCPNCQKEYSKPNFSKHLCAAVYKNEIQAIRELYTNNCTIKNIKKQFPNNIVKLALKGFRRSKSEAMKMRLKRDTETFKCTETKRKILSEKMKLAHKEGRNLGWAFVNQNTNRRSYPEKFFYELFKSKGLFEKYIIKEKFSFGKYFLDFAVIDLKLDIEIDGRRHFISERAIEHDQIRNQFLIDNGWKVYRIAWNLFCKNKLEEIQKLLAFIENIVNETSHFYKIEDVCIQKEKRRPSMADLKQEYETKQQPLIEKVLNSDIDFSKFGWVCKVAKLTGMKSQKVNHWMKRFLPELYQKQCFKKFNSSLGHFS